MDIYCPRCSEPFDVLELHDNDLDASFDEARELFFAEGCGEVFGTHCKPNRTLRSEASALLAELLGDDVDGIASTLDDFDYAGMLD